MNVTLSIDKDTLDAARQVAAAQGTTVNAMVRAYLGTLARDPGRAQWLAALQQHWDATCGDSKGWDYRREDAYEERT